MRRWERIRTPWRAWDDAVLRRNLGVYLHIPFCLHRCTYCDFLTYGDKRPVGLTPPAYVDALVEEIRRRGEWASAVYGGQGRYVDTVFFGGGTPTYLEPEVLARLVRAVYESFPIRGSGDGSSPTNQRSVSEAGQPQAAAQANSINGVDASLREAQGRRRAVAATGEVEFTVEANPDTLTRHYLDVLAEAGVNRLSVGVQATQTRHLRLMQRTHRWLDIAPRLAWLAAGPIPRYSFDLIYGLPGMTATEVKQSLRRLLEFRPRHISAYELIYEPGTPLYRWLRRFQPQELPERERLAQHHAIGRLLADHGLYRYEISNYATPGEESRHNLRYWRGGDYIGLGLGAASRIGTEVVNNPRKFEVYRAQLAGMGSPSDPLAQTVAAQQQAGLFNRSAPPADVFLMMRTRAGMELNGKLPDPRWGLNGWVKRHGRQLEVTSRGLAFADLYHKVLA